MQLRDLYRQAKDSLAAKTIESAALDARILIGHALGLSHEEFLLAQNRDVSAEEIERINSLVAQRLQHKPVAKIIGYKEFYGRGFLTNEHTLDPRPDSEILIDAVRAHCPQDDLVDILDMGTGTGCLLLTCLAEFLKSPRAIGTAVDFSMRALAVAQQNAENLHVADRVVFIQSDWFEKVTGTFDVLISNPPYIPSCDIETLSRDVQDFDPRSALDGGEDGLDPYRLITNQAPDYLKPGGLIVFEVGIGQAQDVAQMLENKGFQAMQIINDLSGIQRVVLAKRA